MELSFWKMSGAGNDFVMFNNMDLQLFPTRPERSQFIQEICRRGTGVGADGVILTEPSAAADFAMRYYNSDGGEAETCGNGSRCVARFAHLQGIAGPSMRFETQAGIYQAEVNGETVTVSMSEPHTPRYGISLQMEDAGSISLDFLNTGVPHAVVCVDDVENCPVAEWGKFIRFHETFAPAGANVNFIQPIGPDRLRIRTYERGVEGETLACGTGCIASAIVAQHHGLVQAPVTLVTQSGVELIVHFEASDASARQVRLEGEARLVYTGTLPYWISAR